jgi:hypothetical protein
MCSRQWLLLPALLAAFSCNEATSEIDPETELRADVTPIP